MREPTLVQQLAEFSASVTFTSLPPAVVSSIKNRLLDTIGVCLAAVPLETSRMAVQLAAGWGAADEATVIGFPHRLSTGAAAFVNGVLAHTLDFDDTHLPSVLHPSATILPVALAVAESTGAASEEMLAAAAVGYEVCIRTGMAGYDRTLGNSVFFEHGWHATSICGTLAGAAVAAKLYGLDVTGIGNALGIAASMASGILEGNRVGGTVKRLHCGWAAHAGIGAAQAARAGFTGPASALEGRFGFYRAFCRGFLDSEEITRGLGSEWSIPAIFFKPYPANHFTHAGIDAAIALREVVALDQIASIELRVPAAVLRTIAEPAMSKARPQTGYQAQFSGPFTVAAALSGGTGLGLYLDDLTDARVHDEQVLQLAAKVRCIADSECDAIFPIQFPAILRIRTRDGAVHERKVLANRGGERNPLSAAELELKFTLNASRTVAPGCVAELAVLIQSIESHSIRRLMGLTQPTSHADARDAMVQTTQP